ncbi:hypothetical protein ACFY3N_26270 [Streptomyces sp. NPDC000348]|uniref:hypothetical protein n=1 Tax=Streptomyces sp. NPDC000348 TaxID=3364538 RepID=UPI0036C0C3D6
MNVLPCATCGTRLTAPVRRLDGMPGYSGWDGLPGPDGRAGTGHVRACGAGHVRACGAEAAIVAADRTGGYGTRPVPDAVHVEAAR